MMRRWSGKNQALAYSAKTAFDDSNPRLIRSPATAIMDLISCSLVGRFSRAFANYWDADTFGSGMTPTGSVKLSRCLPGIQI